MRRVTRVLLRIIGGLLVLELVYVAAAVLLVETGQVERWLNKNPEKRRIRFESAWSVIPGVAHVRGFHMVHQGRGDQIKLVVDRATGFVDPVELLVRRVHVVGLEAHGVEFRLRKRPKTLEEAEAREAVVAPIEGMAFEPYRGPPEVQKKKPGWTVAFTNARLRDVRELWIETVRFRGEGEVAASVTVGPGPDRRISIRSADVRCRAGELAIAGDGVLQGLALRLEGRMEPFHTKQTRGKALLPLISAEAKLSGNASTAAVLDRYFGKADWLEFTSGPRRLTAQLEVERGKVLPGGHVELEEGPLGARFAGFIAEGQATALLETHAGDPGDVAGAEVSVAFAEYGMRRRVDGPPAMLGESLLIQARSSADLQHFPPEDFEGRIELGNAEFPDLVFVNDLIPEGAGLIVKGGRAVVDGHFETGKDAACRGSVQVTTTGLVLEAAGVETAGDAELTIQVPEGNLDELRFSLDGTRLALDRFAFTSQGSAEDAPDFWARFALTDGDLDLGEAAGIDTLLELSLSDTRPLVAFLSRDKPLRGWKERLLTIHEITGEGDLELTKETATIRQVEVSGGKVGIQGRVYIGDEGPFGKVFGRYGILKVGIGLEGEERDVKVFGVGNWYKKDDISGMPPLPREAPKDPGR